MSMSWYEGLTLILGVFTVYFSHKTYAWTKNRDKAEDTKLAKSEKESRIKELRAQFDRFSSINDVTPLAASLIRHGHPEDEVYEAAYLHALSRNNSVDKAKNFVGVLQIRVAKENSKD